MIFPIFSEIMILMIRLMTGIIISIITYIIGIFITIKYAKKKDWDVPLSKILILIIFGGISYTVLYIKLLNHRISNLRKEEATIIGLINKYQEDYFKLKKISREAYNAAVDKHQERILKIKETMPILESKLKTKGKKRRFSFLRNFNKLKSNKPKKERDVV